MAESHPLCLTWPYHVIHRQFPELTEDASKLFAMTREIPPGHQEDLVPEVAPTSKTVPGVDDALLAEAQQLLDIGTEEDTINQALAELIRERRRLEAVESQIRRYQAGQFATLHRPGARP